MPSLKTTIPILAFAALLMGVAFAWSLEGLAFEVAYRTLAALVGGLGAWLVWHNRPEDPGRERQAWTLLAGGMLCWTVGVVLHLLDVNALRAVRGATWSDSLFLLASLFTMVGLARFPVCHVDPGARKLLLLDQIIAALSAGSVYWHLVLTPNFHDFEGKTLLRVGLSLAYPVAEFVIIQMSVDLVVRGPLRKESGGAYKWTALAFVILLSSDILHEVLVGSQAQWSRIVLHMSNVAFAVCVLMGAHALRRHGDSRGAPASGPWSDLREALVPLAWVTLPGLSLAWLLLMGGVTVAWDLVVVVAILIILVLVRQRVAESRLASNLHSALLTSLLPATLGFQLVALVVVALILSLTSQEAASRIALVQTQRFADAIPMRSLHEIQREVGAAPESQVVLLELGTGARRRMERVGLARMLPEEVWSQRSGFGFRIPPRSFLPQLITWARPMGDSGKVLVISTPLRDQLRSGRKAGSAVMILFALAAFLTTWIVFRRARRLAQPLEQLTLAAAAVQGGNLSVRTGITGPDEVGRLGQAMDSMVERLGQMLQEQIHLTDQAREASLAKSRFLANMSHEIRTPLNGVLGMADLLAVSELGTEAQGLVDGLKSSASTLRNLVGDILDLSKIEADQIVMEFIPFSVRDLVDDVLALFQPLAQAKGVGLSSQWFSPIPKYCLGDVSRLRQILSNLLSNALKFTVQGKVEVRSGISASGLLAFEVEDTGLGIQSDAQARIWQPFAQADESTTRRFGGTGLGLSISRSLARLLGGDLVLVRSQIGSGSSFLLTTPLFEVQEEMGPRVEAPVAQAQPLGLEILVAEDNLVNQKVILGFLRKLGCQATLVEDGLAAVERATQSEWDLILMDVHMPRMDGLEAVRTLRAQGYQREIWALTASALGEEKERCLEAGMDGFLTKPLGLSDLRAALAKLPRSD